MNNVTLEKRLRMNLLIKQAFIRSSVYTILTGIGPNYLKEICACLKINNFRLSYDFQNTY